METCLPRSPLICVSHVFAVGCFGFLSHLCFKKIEYAPINMSKLRFQGFSGKRLPVSTNNFSEIYISQRIPWDSLSVSLCSLGLVYQRKVGQSEGIEAKTIQKCYDLNGMRWAIVSQIVGESFVQIIFSNCYGKYIYHYIYKLNHNLSLLSSGKYIEFITLSITCQLWKKRCIIQNTQSVMLWIFWEHLLYFRGEDERKLMSLTAAWKEIANLVLKRAISRQFCCSGSILR